MTTIQHETPAPLVALCAVLDRAADAMARRHVADVDLLLAAVEWAEAHPAPVTGPFAGWGEVDLYGEGVIPLSGAGAPLVAEFAPVELAAVLHWSTDAARELMGDGLELKHRLPLLYAHVLAGRVPVHLGRHVARHTRDLTPVAAAHADRLVSADPQRVGRVRAERLIDEARLYHDPDRAIDDELQSLAERRVELLPGATPLTTDVHMRLDTHDAEAFGAAVARAAEALKRLGDNDPLDVRRARAVGVLADPQRALDLFADGPPGRTPAPASLVLHLDADQLERLTNEPTVVTVEGGHSPGPVLLDVLRSWLADSVIRVLPVLDMSRVEAVDRHDPPPWMADLVRLRDPVCVFPGCHRPSRACDLDHIEPYVDPDDGGPPGQTRPDNLAPLCRHHHRAKTHGAWGYRRLPDGSYRWTSPTGRMFEVLPAPARPRHGGHVGATCTSRRLSGST
jgi:hypothetical protein